MHPTHPLDAPSPPWLVFPYLTAQNFTSYLGQGEVDWYMNGCFVPFWLGLDALDREAYFDYWDATEEWREEIRFVLEPDFDVEQDAAESEAYHAMVCLRRAEEEAARPRSFFSRLFRRR